MHLPLRRTALATLLAVTSVPVDPRGFFLLLSADTFAAERLPDASVIGINHYVPASFTVRFTFLSILTSDTPALLQSATQYGDNKTVLHFQRSSLRLSKYRPPDRSQTDPYISCKGYASILRHHCQIQQAAISPPAVITLPAAVLRLAPLHPPPACSPSFPSSARPIILHITPAANRNC